MREKPSQRMKDNGYTTGMFGKWAGVLHQGNDERENLPWRREKKEGYLSPNMRIRRQYKKTIKKAGKYQPTGAETPAELEERNELSGDGMRRLHDGYEKARYSREGCTKEEAEALRN